jgi:hypothetical protein
MGMVDGARDGSGDATEAAGEQSNQPEKSEVRRSWTERALSEPSPNSPFYVPPPPKWAARLSLVMQYVLYVGMPIICAAATIWIALRQKWLGAGMLLLLTVWECYRGWNGVHGRTPYGPGNLPELRRQLKD